MVNKEKKVRRFFQISDFIEEENWLSDQHKKGWKLISIESPTVYLFEQTKPEDVVYKLDFQDKNIDTDYQQIFKDYGWEYCGINSGWHYFRKLKIQTINENENEIFSDNESKLAIVDQLIKKRLFNLLIILLVSAVLHFLSIKLDYFSDRIEFLLNTLFIVLYIVIVPILLVSGYKLLKLKNKYKN